MGNYQKFKGDPENKLFYLLDGLVGGINTEFSDDASSDVDFDSIVNFDVDKLGTLTKRNGFGKIKGLATIFQRGDLEGYSPQTDLPMVHNITEDFKNVEEANDNIVYVKLLKNDNNCFRNLAAFDNHFDYQKQYGFQNNEFKLLMITTKVENGVCVSSKAWYYFCRLPETTEDNFDTIVFNAYSCDLPVIFKWDKTLMNMDSIEYFSNIWFTNNDKALVRFDRNAEIKSNEDLDNAFHYVGVVEGKENEAYLPQLNDYSNDSRGVNLLCTNPMYDIKRYSDNTSEGLESIQGAFLLTTDLKVLDTTLLVNEPVYIAILYTGTSDFVITAKNGETDLGVQYEKVEDISKDYLVFYKLVFSTTPSGEVEIVLSKDGIDYLDPLRFFVTTGEISPDAEVIKSMNVGDMGICMMSDNRVAYYKEDVIYFSDINRPDYLPPNNYLKLPLEPTDRITKISFFKGLFIVFTKERIYKLIGNFGSSNFACEPVNTSLGCHAGHTVVPIEDVLYFASPRGLYALKSSTFIEGMQNLIELDIKVKKLTSDFTLYEDELKKPAMRFNGINERAYAFRYKDKYMLFFNSSYEKGDYAAKNNLDVLVYDYSMKSFTTYSFIEKPTFLFMVDNALQTFCTTLEEDTISVEPLEIINYDMENQVIGTNTIEDSSSEDNDGVVEGNLSINQESYALGEFDYIENELLTQNLDFMQDLDLSLDIKLEENQVDKTIFEAIGSGLGDAVSPYSGEYRSEIVNGYEVVFRYDVKYFKSFGGLTSENTNIDFTLSLNRTSTDVLPMVSGVVNLLDVFEDIESSFLYWKPSEDNLTALKVAFSNVAFSANFEDALSVELLSDKLYLDIKGGVKETQKRDIKINVDLTAYEPYSYYEKGAKVSGTDYRQINELTWIRFGIPYSVVAYDGYARMTVTEPYMYHNGAIGRAATPFNISAAGKTMSFTMPKLSTSVTKATEYMSGSKYIDIPYSESILKGDGVYKVTVKASWLYDSSLSNKHYDTLNSSFSLTLPKIQLKEGYNTTEQSFEGNTSYELVYTPPEDDLYMKLMINPSNAPEDLENKEKTLYFEITDYKSGFAIFCSPVDVTERHKYSIKLYTNQIEIHCDGQSIGSIDVPDNYLNDRLWNSFIFGTDKETKEKFLNWEFFDLDFGIFKYDSVGNEQIDEGQVRLVDKSGNGNNAIVYGAEAIPYNGIFFTGTDGYIKLPTFEYGFQIGFTIETDVILKPNDKPYTLFDTAKSYGTDNIKDKNAAISVDVDNGIVSLSAMTKELVDISVATKTPLEYNKEYKLKFVCERVEDTNYMLSVYINDELDNSVKYRNLNIIATQRSSNFLGKSNNQNYDNFKGVISSFRISLNAFNTQFYYPSTIYEFGTSYSDFSKPIYYEVQTKGINLKYPQHLKKLKHIFVKAKGGYKPNDLIFELYTDGYLVNDPKSYYCYVDETGKVVYDFAEISNLTIEERASVLGNITLNHTRLGEGNYQTIKMVIPSKGKNFKIKMYGKNKDYISLESFGFVSKLGKVKQD